jgi:2-oxoglutarate/2-oxoacid ferredoxin oxidoreductase subunit alpha
MCACTAACAPSAARRPRGTCAASSCSALRRPARCERAQLRAAAHRNDGGPTTSTTRTRVNDFALRIATVNGTGSASANGLLMQAIFRMGIPVSGKNVFPSNIQGLPTWYEIRVNHRGHVARTPRFDLIVAMNNATYGRDVMELEAGAYVLLRLVVADAAGAGAGGPALPGRAASRMCADAFAGGRERLLLKNIAYVGALAALFDIPLPTCWTAARGAVRPPKKKLLDANLPPSGSATTTRGALRLSAAVPAGGHAASDDRVLIDGNTAAALGCVYAGATVGAWYPITPATSLMDAFRRFCERYRRDPDTGERTCTSSCRRRTSWRRPASSSAPAGPVRARSRRPAGPASRS